MASENLKVINPHIPKIPQTYIMDFWSHSGYLYVLNLSDLNSLFNARHGFQVSENNIMHSDIIILYSLRYLHISIPHTETYKD